MTADRRPLRRTATATALLTLLIGLLAVVLAAPPATAARLTLAVTASPAAGSKAVLTASLNPPVKGRTLRFAYRAGAKNKRWIDLGKARTDKRGVAALTTKKLRKPGPAVVRVSLAERGSQPARTATSKIVIRPKQQRAGRATSLQAPEWVLAGSDFDIVFSVGGATALAGAVLDVTAPKQGRQVRPPDDLLVTAGQGRLVLGDLAAGLPRTVTLRWQAPAKPGTLKVRASLRAAGVSDRLAGTIAVVRAPRGDLPDVAEGLTMMRMSSQVPVKSGDLLPACPARAPAAPVPAFAAAEKAAQKWLGKQIDKSHAKSWKKAKDLKTSQGAHRVVLMAYADNRLGAMLAAALHGHRLDPLDVRHLNNAAAAANFLQRPDWAVAFATQGAGLPPAPGSGIAQEAVRLNNLGHAWAKLGDLARAESALRQALLVSPDHPALQAELATILTCAGRNDEALPVYVDSMRNADAPDEVNVRDKHTDVTASRVFDLSAGVQPDKLDLIEIPATWGQLIALEGRDGPAGREEDALDREAVDLVKRESALIVQLNAQDREPAQQRRTRDALQRMGAHASPETLAAYTTLRTAWTSWRDTCFDVNRSHPWCNIDGWSSDFTCGDSAALFTEWSRRGSVYRNALLEYYRIGWPVWTGVQANLADPVAHELAGVRLRSHLLTQISAIPGNVRHQSEEFRDFNTATHDGPSNCVGPEAPAETPVTSFGRAAAPMCPSNLKGWAVEVEILIAAVKLNCEKFSVELKTPAPFLAAFARVEMHLNPQGYQKGSTVVMGMKSEIPLVASAENAVYFEQDAAGRFTDIGYVTGHEVEVGTGVKYTLLERKAKFSILNTTPSYSR